MKDRLLKELVQQSVESQEHFCSHWDGFTPDPLLTVDKKTALSILLKLEQKLQENYPFFHPRYAGQMLKPPHEIAIAAYLTAMQINPNNHALDGGPATAKMETEVVAKLAHMFGYEKHLGHLTSSGTIANLEALWVAKSIHPEKTIAFSASAHYTHKRMCEVIDAKYICLESFENIEDAIVQHNIGTIVVTIGTTSLGEVEPLHKILPIAKKHGVRLHADAAYGGFYVLLTKEPDPLIAPQPFLALPECDSIVVDPHKHGLQPYGCGCILFKDSTVGKFYKHDSPYTYFTSDELHLGEISLECSRAGAAAAALWATLECFPLEPQKGIGAILQKTRKAATTFSSLICSNPLFCEYDSPHLDIVTYFPKAKPFSASSVSTAVQNLFTELMNNVANPLYLATLLVDSNSIAKKFPDFIADAPVTKIFRSVLMKPEHENFVPAMVEELTVCFKKHLS